MVFCSKVGALELEKLCSWSQEGWILAPQEEKTSVIQRKETLESVNFPKEQKILLPLYDLEVSEVPLLVSNRSLWPWQGAVLWQYWDDRGRTYPVIQVRENGGGKKQEEALAHELVHFSRFSFSEPLFEEILAYKTSSSLWKSFFGPLFMRPWEATCFVVFSFLPPFFAFWKDSFLGGWVFLSACFFLLLRLCLLHGIFALARRKLCMLGILKEKTLPILLRLSDWETIKLAFCFTEKIRAYLQKQEGLEDRIKCLVETYYKIY